MAYKRRLRFDKRIRFQKKMNIIYILLFVVLTSVGVGYAYISTQLNINGTANVTAARWDVHFTNLNVTTGSVTATTAATITNPTTVTFAATLDEPKDFYEFTVDVVNGGTMDAMIDSFNISPTLTTAQKKYLEYTITYSDGTPLLNKQELGANITETLKVRFSYKENVDKTNYPTTDQTFNISFTMSYTQADGTEIPVNHPTYVYTVNHHSSIFPKIGQAIPEGIIQYNTAADALDAISLDANSSVPFYFKHRIEGGIVTESYIEFIISQAMASTNPGMTAGTYAIRGFDTYDDNASTMDYCKSEYYNATEHMCISPYFESNKEVLLSAFGSSNCRDFYSGMECRGSQGTYVSADIRSNGMIQTNCVAANCIIYNDGVYYCTIF